MPRFLIDFFEFLLKKKKRAVPVLLNTYSTTRHTTYSNNGIQRDLLRAKEEASIEGGFGECECECCCCCDDRDNNERETEEEKE